MNYNIKLYKHNYKYNITLHLYFVSTTIIFSIQIQIYQNIINFVQKHISLDLIILTICIYNYSNIVLPIEI